MKKPSIIIIVFCICLLTLKVNSQENKKQSKIFLSSSIGNSFASTGDFNGLFVLVGLSKERKKTTLAVDVITTLHNGYNPLFFSTYPGGPVNDGSIRYSTGGVQVSFSWLYHLLNFDKHKLKLGFGAGVRYQSSSYYDSYQILYPALTGLDFPVVVFSNREPMRTISALPMLQLNYEIKLSKKINIGALGSFQIDTNGDNFLNYGVKFGYQLL
jgi:hypothetical protein